MGDRSWRQVFTELSEGIFRELGFDPPAVHHEVGLPLVMELELENRRFDLLHPYADKEDRILVTCTLGQLSGAFPDRLYEKFLTTNLACMRNHEAWYGMNAETGEVVWLISKKLEGLGAREFVHYLRNMAIATSGWEEKFSEGAEKNNEEVVQHFGTSLA